MEHKLDFPYKFKELEPEEISKLNGFHSLNYQRVGPKGYLMLRPYQKDAANIYNMPLRPDDIFVASYQRSGTTWTQELVWLLASNLDYNTAEKVSLLKRYAFLDQFMYLDEDLQDHYVDVTGNVENIERLKNTLKDITTPKSRMLATAPSPRFIKTHLPMSLLPPNILDTAKVVYVARDPRDVAVSSYHHARLFKILGFNGEFKDFWNLFTKSLYTLTPYFEHVKEAWDMRKHPNMLFLFYEELSKDLPGSVRRVAEFLGKQLATKETSRLCEHLKFENFKKNITVNNEKLRELDLLAKDESFIRKGISGGWREYFDEEMTRQAEHWIENNLRDTDLRFPHM